MIKKLKNIKNNIANLDNSAKNQAYLNVFDEIINSGDSDLSISEIANDIANNSKYASSKSPMNRLATGIANFKEGFSENFNNPLQAENLKPVEGKTIGTKIGEVLGTAARFADSPLGRMAIMGGITAIGGGTPMEMLRYGIGAGVLNQGLRNQDSMYRQQLLNSGVAPEALDKIKGYIMPETYNNFVKGQYMHDNTEIDKKYKEGMVDIYKQNAETDREYKQAKNNFTKLLPNMSCCNLLSTVDNPEDSRIVFSTYQTMINAIDSTKSKTGNKLFTPGHFDLIIVDEAHRSIYKKYQAIFDYFDGLVVGLTATPRNDVDRNTYRFFEIENDVPTFAYEYERAVKEGYLVDYHTIKTSTDFMDRGIKYNELSEEEKEEYENTFADDEDNIPEEIDATAINSWLFNRDTIKKLLELLMEKGIKVEGGDKLGKTIIFARNHKHAERIVEIFNELYPEYRGEFAKLIDNQVKYNENLIEHFSIKDDLPQIAVSVDMLDTGVDVPEILNLVFFKPVKSKIKFWQMIGRGTRLCKDLFGVGQDKKEFYIFDYCKNFEFFFENPKGIEANTTISLTERIYGYKLDLIVELQNLKYQSNDKFKNYREQLIEQIIEEKNKLNKESFLVKAKVHYIEQFSKKENWVYISTIDLADIKENLIPLFIASDENESAKRFDNLLYQLQVKRIRTEKTSRCENAIIDTVSELEKLGTVPQVKEKQELILKVAETDYLKEADFWKVEEIRKELRDLIQFIDPYNRPPVYIDIEDTLNDIDEEYVYISTGNNFTNYRKKLEKFLTGNLENSIIWKIRHNIRLTELEKENLEKILFEELGSNKEYAETFGDTNVIKAVRSIVGLDKSVASDIFYKYINENRLNMKQIQFVKLLVDYVVKNGTIEMEKLTEQPFNTVGQVYELFGNNVDLFKEIREDIEEINENAEKLA